MSSMNRRDALKTTAVLGGALAGVSLSLDACASERTPDVAHGAFALSVDDQRLLEDVADTMLPTTPSSPGAKAAGVGPAIALLLSDCYDRTAQQRATDGLAALRTLCTERCGGSFTKLSPGERERLLTEIDAEAVRAGREHWFHLMRDLALQSYFSSEIGMTRALRYIRVPGHWTGCLPLEPGQPAWG